MRRTKGGPVDIGYMRAGALHRIQAKHCVLACYNMMIPHIMPELPEPQKQALALSVKMPLVYVNVAVRNWQAFVKLGVDDIYSPLRLLLEYQARLSRGARRLPQFARAERAHAAAYGAHTRSRRTKDSRTSSSFGWDGSSCSNTPFAEYETRITDQLDRMLGPGGFQSARDIAAITVNRWPHGYAYSADSLFDPETSGPPPYEIARRRCGSVTIANSDAGWNSYTHEAIDQAWRAVNELKQA